MLSKLIEELRTNSNLMRHHYGDVGNEQMMHTGSDFYAKNPHFKGEEEKFRSRGVHTSVGNRRDPVKQEQRDIEASEHASEVFN